MERLWSILKITLLVILSVLFLMTLIFSLTTSVFDRKLMQQDFYKSQLRQNNFYERVYTDILPEIKALPNYYGGLSISQQEASDLIKKIMPPQWLQQQVETTLDSAIPWLRSDKPDLNLTIDLVPIKQNAKPLVIQFIKDKLDSLPVTPAGQQIDPNQVLALAAAGQFPPSLPGGPERQAIEQQAMAQLTPYVNQNIDNAAPDKLDLVQEIADQGHKSRADVLSDFDSARDGTKWVTKVGVPLSYLFLAILLVLIALLNWGKLRAALRWVGGTMLFTGLPLLVIGIYAHAAGPNLAKTKLQDAHDIPPSILRLISDLSGTAIKEVSWAFIVPLIVVTGIGLILFVLSFLVRRSEAKASQ